MAQLLIVDDNEPLRRWVERVLTDGGHSCDGAADAEAARARLRASSYRLVLLDVNLPGESGMDLLVELRRDHPDTGVVMVTGEDSAELAMAAIELGAYGYLVKPVAAGELLINVAGGLQRRRTELQNRRIMARLRSTVNQRSEQLAQSLQDLQLAESGLWASQAETIFRLARLVEFRDEEEGGRHLQRMSSYCAIIAHQLGLGPDQREKIRVASQVHDVGNVAVPDEILSKRDRLSADEFEIVKGHAEAGHRMLAGSASEVVRVGAVIAHTHHERWDGAGYPRGLAGEEIPLEGRIAAVADVFEALTSDRLHRPALPVASAISMMERERGAQFDPAVMDAFLGSREEIEAARQEERD